MVGILISCELGVVVYRVILIIKLCPSTNPITIMFTTESHNNIHPQLIKNVFCMFLSNTPVGKYVCEASQTPIFCICTSQVNNSILNQHTLQWGNTFAQNGKCL